MRPDIKNHDKVVSLLGKRVRVTLSYGGYPDEEKPATVSEGKLLAFSSDGSAEIVEDDGFVHYCWPMLDIEEVTD